MSLQIAAGVLVAGIVFGLMILGLREINKGNMLGYLGLYGGMGLAALIIYKAHFGS